MYKICQFFVGVFLLYNGWYSQIWGANRGLLYLSVGLSIVFMLIDAGFVLKKISINKINPIVKMYIIFGIYALMTGIIVSVNTNEFLSSMFTYTSFTIIALEVWYISFRIKDFKWILKYIYFIALLCAVTTIFYGKDYRTEVIVTTMSQYNNPNTLGVLMVFGIFSVMFQNERMKKYFLFMYMSVLVFLYVILLTGSRKALFAGAGLYCIWLFEYIRERKKEKITLVSMLLLLITVASLVGTYVYIKKIYIEMSGFTRLRLFFQEGGTDGRISLIKLAVQCWKNSPIFGVGMDQFRFWNPYGCYSHSTYTEILSCTGVMGTLIFFIPLIGLLKVSIKKAVRRKKGSYQFRICSLMLMVELFLGMGQIFIYSALHMIILLFISNIVYEEIECENKKEISS